MPNRRAANTPPPPSDDPEWLLATFERTAAELAKDVQIALLQQVQASDTRRWGFTDG